MVRNVLALLTFSAFMLSCGKTENIFNKLSQAEKDALALREELECLSRNGSLFESLKNDTAENVFRDNSFARHANFKFSGAAGGLTEKFEGTLQVWKQDPTYIIFHVVQTNPTDDNFFLRFTKTQNDTMVDDLKTDFCKRGSSKLFQTASIASSGSVTFVTNYSRSIPAGKQTEFNDTFAVTVGVPVFFANYGLSRAQTTRSINEEGEVVDEGATTASFKSSLSAGGLGEFTLPYTDTRVFTQRFCDIVPGGPNGEYRVEFNYTAKGYQIPAGTTCPTTLPVGWNMDVED